MNSWQLHLYYIIKNEKIEKSISRKQSNFNELKDKFDKLYVNVSSMLLIVQSINNELKDKIY